MAAPNYERPVHLLHLGEGVSTLNSIILSSGPSASTNSPLNTCCSALL
jgi:hypothetical protein